MSTPSPFFRKTSYFARLSFFIAILALIWTSHALAAKPPSYQERFAQLERSLKAEPSAPESLSELHELQSLGMFLEDGTQIYAVCEALYNARRSTPEMRLAAAWCLYEQEFRSGDISRIENAVARLGLVTRWVGIGPFDNEGGAGMDSAFPPEESYDPDLTTQGKIRPVAWRDFPPISKLDGYQDFRRVLNPSSQTLAYAYGRIHAEKDQSALLVIGAGGALKVWLNGKSVVAWNEDRPARRWQHLLPVRLKKGPNEILVKSGCREKDWGFRLGLLALDGKPLPGLTGLTSSPRVEELAPFVKTTFDLKQDVPEMHFPPSIEALQKAMQTRPSVRTALTLSRLHRERHAFTREKRLDEEWAETALKLSPDDPEALLWCDKVFTNHNRRLDCLLRGAKKAPDDPRFSLRLAQFYEQQGQFFTARAYLEPILRHPAVDIEAVESMVHLNNDREWNVESLTLARELFQRHPGARQVKVILSKQLERLGLDDEAAQLRLQLHTSSPGVLATLQWLYGYHYGRHEAEQALAIGKKILELSPGDLANHQRLARLLIGMNRQDEAKAILQAGLSIAPEEASLLDRLAEIEHQAGHKDEALSLWKRSLALMPQNPELKQYLRVLEPDSASYEKPYVRDIKDLLKDYPPRGEEEDAVELLDLTVHKVFENGLSSRFQQNVVRVLTDNGVSLYRYNAIRYSPDRQELKILKARVIKPDGRQVERVTESERGLDEMYKIYYDTRAQQLEFPDLEPGDVVELQYRLDDIGKDNLFADYFGTLLLMQSWVPLRERRAVILMPKDKLLYANTPVLAPEPAITQVGGDIEYDWLVRDAPKVRSEPNSPPAVELADYLHVSTFKDWAAMGFWYWGLVKDQFVAKDALKKKVREIIEGANGDEEKARRIYNWVVTNTRYVGLEFGIHGFKPYQVNQIFERRFGDCKDKATLMVTMFREAGIPAKLAIIRTSNIGKLNDFPPSLAMFNHAIAYLPGFDLYLDGTAEFSGYRELPFQDRGGQVMLIDDGKTSYTSVPADDPSGTITQEKAVLRFQGDDAVMDETMTFSGSKTSLVRNTFQDAKRRKEMLEKLVNRDLPGATVSEFNFSDLTNLDQPVTIKYQATVPRFLRNQGDGRVFQAHLDRVDLVKNLASLSKRENPVAVDRLETRSTYVRFVIGPEWRILGVPESLKLDTPYASFDMTVTIKDDAIEIKNKLVFKVNRIYPDDYPQFREFCEAVTRAYKEEITLAPKH